MIVLVSGMIAIAAGHASPACSVVNGGTVADPSLARAWGWQPRIAWREGILAYCDWYRRGKT